MSFLDRLCNALGIGISPDPFTLDHVPEKALEIDWRDEAIKRAAEKHGKEFRCGPDSVPRERFVGREQHKEVVRPKATVTNIRRRK